MSYSLTKKKKNVHMSYLLHCRETKFDHLYIFVSAYLRSLDVYLFMIEKYI